MNKDKPPVDLEEDPHHTKEELDRAYPGKLAGATSVIEERLAAIKAKRAKP